MKKYNQFEIFRFIGAISVIIFHTARNTDFYNKIPILFQNGSIWVYFFFVLSGFMLTYSYSDKEVNIKKFYIIYFFFLFFFVFFFIINLFFFFLGGPFFPLLFFF